MTKQERIAKRLKDAFINGNATELETDGFLTPKSVELLDGNISRVLKWDSLNNDFYDEQYKRSYSIDWLSVILSEIIKLTITTR